MESMDRPTGRSNDVTNKAGALEQREFSPSAFRPKFAVPSRLNNLDPQTSFLTVVHY